jgi:uncharacterized protein
MTGCTTDTTANRTSTGGADPAQITCFLVKIASRCNLACDYCYVYFHADQSWRDQPKVMSGETRRKLAERVAEYARETGLERVLVVYHGGEPLLAGASTIAETCQWVREALPLHTAVDFSLQTNGVLLDDVALSTLSAAGVGISLSIDGPREAQDRHRVTTGGRSSFDATLSALDRLKRRPSIFSGVIAVIDPAAPPVELLEFFVEHQVPRVDFLLPDANHLRPPPRRDVDATLYARWLIEAFDLWFDRYAQLPVRIFESILDGLAGLPSGTDAFGFGDISLLVIETDGGYHDLDVLKVTRAGATALGASLEDTSVAAAAKSDQIEAHRALLRYDGLSETCRRCPEVEICGGGAVPHRYGEESFNHPTVYCQEMLTLIRHARSRVLERLRQDRARSQPAFSGEPEVDLSRFDTAETAANVLDELLARWKEDAAHEFRSALQSARSSDGRDSINALDTLDPSAYGDLAIQPTVVAWSRVMTQGARGRGVRSLSGQIIEPDPGYARTLSHMAGLLVGRGLRVHRDDPWLRVPFADDRLEFEQGEVVVAGRALAEDALDLVRQWRPSLLSEMERLSREIVFIRDLTADPDKCVSFSDDSIPGALYCSIRRSGDLISPADLADSLIHEHRHQKLYLLGRRVKLLDRDRPLVASPWRDDLRPPSGLLHAVFVFVELLGLWRYLALDGSSAAVSARASEEVRMIKARLRSAFATLRTVALTSTGDALVEHLETRAGSSDRDVG